jgi:hypothetical protein
MTPSAYITSVNALTEFRAGVCTFAEEARNALTELDMEIRRAVEWLSEQQQFWKAEVRAAEDAVILARNELARRRMMRIGDRPPDTTDQEKILARAIQRLDHAQEKLARTKHWLMVLPDEIREYEGPSRLFQDIVASDLPKVAALLERKIAALEAYAAANSAIKEPRTK